MPNLTSTLDGPVDRRPHNDGRRGVAIVIPCLNEEAVIAEVIRQVLCDTGLEDLVVIVADGGSSDRSVAIVEEIARSDPRVRLLLNAARLQSAGVNLAADTLVKGINWLVRVDAHADYPADYTSILIGEAVQTGADSVVVSMDTRGEAGFQRGVAAAQNSVLGTGGSAHRGAARGQWVDHGHHALFRLAAFREVGGYDESFSHNEDAELDVRLVGASRRIWLTDKVRIGYHPRATASALARQYYGYGRGRARTAFKHHTRLKLRQAAPLVVAPAVLLLLLTPLSSLFVLPALGWATACLAAGWVLSVKQRDEAVLASGLAAMIMHLSWSYGFWSMIPGRNRKTTVLATPPRPVPT